MLSVVMLVLSIECSDPANGQLGFHLGHWWTTDQTLGRGEISRELPDSEWYQQKLDHFDNADLRTWNQRYFVNSSVYQPGNPVFLMIGGESPANPVWNVNGQWSVWAREFGALFLQLEHRYYGQSRPTSDASVENLRYLSSEQALADLAGFRTAMAHKYGAQKSKWIVFGGSYAGSLAAWFSLKYPHLVDGAVATSAPLFAVVNFEDYYGVVAASLSKYSRSCVTTISAAVVQMEELLRDESGWKTLSSKFRLCSTLNGKNANDVTSFYSFLAGNVASMVQYNNLRGTSISKGLNIATICGILDNRTIGTELERYAKVSSWILDRHYKKDCINVVYRKTIDYLRNTTWDHSSSGARQWTYQTCTEFGFYQSSSRIDQPFGDKFPLKFIVRQCADIFGTKFDEVLLRMAVENTNTIYGGFDLKIRKVIFPHGSIDPWQALGILQGPNAVYIEDSAHCADMNVEEPTDPPQLVKARLTIRQKIATWLED